MSSDLPPPVLSKFWLVCAALALSLAWLLPNHVPPWASFHADAWSAIVLALVSAFVILKGEKKVAWHGLVFVCALLIVVVVVQYAFGLIDQFGVAWINMIFLLGFLLALLTGSSWETACPLQCADFLFFAVLVGASVSVGLQLHQWLGLEPIGPWILRSNGSRHFANMAQPNQLGSLLLLGVLGCAWLNRRGWLNGYVALLLAMWLLFGLALTESRTGWVNAGLIVAAIFAWRRLNGMDRLLSAAIGLAVFYGLCIIALPTINEFLGTSEVPVELRSILDKSRIDIWKMLIQAASFRPWAGFGWGQVSHAEFLMNIEDMYQGAPLHQAHNLFLDLILWNGIPIGLTVSTLLVCWAWRAVRAVANVYQLMMLLFLAVLFAHAMLEFPLQYAYFLLPAGLMMGALNASLGLRVLFQTPKWLVGCFAVLVGLMLAITIRDYFRVETSMYGLRFEQRKIQTSIPPTPPTVLALTQWRDFIYFARVEPSQTHSGQDLVWTSNLVRTMPSALGMYKFASMLAFAGKPDEAQHWLKVLCRINAKPQCEAIRIMWLTESEKHTAMAAVPWPLPAP